MQGPWRFALIAFLCLSALYLFQRTDRVDSKLKQETGHLDLDLQYQNWTLLVDPDCWHRILREKPCTAPLRVAHFHQNITSDSRITVAFNITQRAADDFVWFTAGDERRVMLRFPLWKPSTITLEGGKAVDVSVPENLTSFERQWNHSRYIECANVSVRNRAERDKQRVLPLTVINDIMVPYRDFVEEHNKTALLFGGTLLGWYRECSLIPHTTDLDFLMPIEDFDADLERALADRFVLYWFLGDGNSSLETSFHKNGFKTDVFFLFHFNGTNDYVSGMQVTKRRELYWLYPRLAAVCSASLHGHLFRVPCNVEQMLVADYGPDWQVDHSSRNYFFDKSSKNMVLGRKHGPESWNKVFRPMEGYG